MILPDTKHYTILFVCIQWQLLCSHTDFLRLWVSAARMARQGCLLIFCFSDFVHRCAHRKRNIRRRSQIIRLSCALAPCQVGACSVLPFLYFLLLMIGFWAFRSLIGLGALVCVCNFPVPVQMKHNNHQPPDFAQQ